MNVAASHKAAVVIGHITFLALLALAWKYADLRTTAGDSAYQVFKWVNDPGVQVEAHRYSALVPQLSVKLFKMFGTSLQGLLLVASLMHVMVAYGVFLICLYLLKAPRTAVAAALAAVLCTRLTFFGPVLEANYLLSYPFLFFAAFEGHGQKLQRAAGAVMLALLALPALLVHPLGVVVLLYGVLFFWAWKAIGSRTAIGCSLGLAAIFLLLRILLPPTVYEQGQYDLLGHALESDPGTWASWDFLVGHTIRYTTSYLPAALVFIAVVVGLVQRRLARAAAVLATGVVGFLLLMLVTYRGGDTAIMMDRAFLPVAALIALPAVYLLWELNGRWAMAGMLALALVTFLKLRDVSFASRGLQKQYGRVVALVGEVGGQGIRRAEVEERTLREREIATSWALPFSTLLISSVQAPEQALTVRMKTTDQGGAASPVLDLGEAKLDARYFALEAGSYRPWPPMPARP